MAQPYSNKTNLQYARDLRRRGFPTAVHALPLEGVKEVDRMLAERKTMRSIANYVNKKYADHLRKIDVRPLSHYAIGTYRKSFWKDSPEFVKAVIGSTPQLDAAAKNVLEEYDAITCMVEMARAQYERTKKLLDKEKSLPLPLDSGTELIAKTFELNSKVLDAQIRLGVKSEAPMKVDVDITDKSKLEELSEEEVQLRAERMIKAGNALLRKGQYARKSTDQSPT